MGSSAEQWRKLLHQCLIRRIDGNEFKSLAKLLSRRAPLAESSLLDVVLESRAVVNAQWDPLVPVYIDILTKLGTVRIPTVLQSLLKHSSIVEQSQTATAPDGAVPSDKKKTRDLSTLMTDTRTIQDAMISISTGTAPISTTEAMKIFSVVAEWILEVVRWHTSNVSEDQQTGGLMSSPDAISLFESLGILLAALSGTEKGLEALSSDSPEGTVTYPLEQGDIFDSQD
jgi:mediator of RNA polymerase II transcription subunit 5